MKSFFNSILFFKSQLGQIIVASVLYFMESDCKVNEGDWACKLGFYTLALKAGVVLFAQAVGEFTKKSDQSSTEVDDSPEALLEKLKSIFPKVFQFFLC